MTASLLGTRRRWSWMVVAMAVLACGPAAARASDDRTDEVSSAKVQAVKALLSLICPLGISPDDVAAPVSTTNGPTKDSTSVGKDDPGVGGGGGKDGNISVDHAPEPATLLLGLLGTGVAGAVAVYRKRKALLNPE